MRTRETFYRTAEIKRERRTLPAVTYNLARILFSRHRPDALFVPVRSMLYLAVIDDEEFVFLDGAVSRNRIELAWQNFQVHERSRLDDPISYEAVYYTNSAVATMQRLQGEFLRALSQLRDKEKFDTPAQIIPLRGGRATR